MVTYILYAYLFTIYQIHFANKFSTLCLERFSAIKKSKFVLYIFRIRFTYANLLFFLPFFCYCCMDVSS